MFTWCNVYTVQCLHWAGCALHRAHQIPWGTEEHIRGIRFVACNPVVICGGRRLSMAVAGRRKVVFCKEDFVQPIFQWKQLFSKIPMFHHLLTKAALKHSLDDVDWFSEACVGELTGHQGIINPLNTKTFQSFLGFSQSIFSLQWSMRKHFFVQLEFGSNLYSMHIGCFYIVTTTLQVHFWIQNWIVRDYFQ